MTDPITIITRQVNAHGKDPHISAETTRTYKGAPPLGFMRSSYEVFGRVLRETIDDDTSTRYLIIRWRGYGISVYRVLDIITSRSYGYKWTCIPIAEDVK